MNNKAGMNRVFSSAHFDAVIHFAGYKAVGESVEKPLMYYENNICGTLVLLDMMKKYGVENLIFSSSATVYGIPEKCPVTENSPLSTLNPYGRTKLMIEDILRDVASADKTFSTVLLRYFNPVGCHPSGLISEDPNGIPNNLMPRIIQAVMNTDQANSGTLNRVIPGARMFRKVVMILIAPRMDEAPETWTAKIARSIE